MKSSSSSSLSLISRSSLLSQPSSSFMSSAEFLEESPVSILAPESGATTSSRLRNVSSLPAKLERKESFNSQLSSPSSSNISAFISFASSCQFPGIQGAQSICIKVLQAHQGHINALTVSGRFLYTTSSSSNSIHAWKLPELEEVCKFGRGDGAVKSLLAVGSELILSAHQDHKIRVWKTSALSAAEKSKETPAQVKHLATLPTLLNKLLTFIFSRHYVRIRRHRKTLWIRHSDSISVLAVSWDKHLVFSGSWDKTFKVWRVSDFKCLESVEAHEDAINSIVSSRAGYLYTCSADTKIKAWERSTDHTKRRHSLVATAEGHKAAVNALILSSDEQLLYSASTDRRILIWEREDSANHLSLLGALRGHRQAVLCLAIVDEYLCSGSADKSVRIWRKGFDNIHACVTLLEGHLAPVKVLSIRPASGDYTADKSSSNKYVVYSGSLDSDVRVWLVSPDEFFPSAELETSAAARLKQNHSI